MKTYVALITLLHETGAGHPDQGLPGYGRPDQGLPGYDRPTDPGYGRPGYAGGRPDQGLPGYGHPDQSLPGYGHPGNALPISPVRPEAPVVLPPGVWPPRLPPGVDNTLPPEYSGQPGRPTPPIVIPSDPSVGIEQPIYLPQLPPGSALLIALTGTNVPTPKGAENSKPAILWQGAGTKPVLVYVSATATPK